MRARISVRALAAVAALCSMPGARYSNACGHNAVYWLILTVPLALVLAAILAKRIYVKWHTRMRKRET